MIRGSPESWSLGKLLLSSLLFFLTSTHSGGGAGALKGILGASSRWDNTALGDKEMRSLGGVRSIGRLRSIWMGHEELIITKEGCWPLTVNVAYNLICVLPKVCTWDPSWAAP